MTVLIPITTKLEVAAEAEHIFNLNVSNFYIASILVVSSPFVSALTIVVKVTNHVPTSTSSNVFIYLSIQLQSEQCFSSMAMIFASAIYFIAICITPSQ